MTNLSKPLPAREDILKVISYCPESGHFHWKVDRPGVKAGDFAMKSVDGRGYLSGRIGGRKYAAHRIAWKVVHGVDPVHIDHIDGNRKNNRIDNLRSVNPTANNRNRSMSSRNTSGINGVSKDVRGWRAAITVSDKAINLGTYPNMELAAAARKGAEKVLGYADKHGKRAPKVTP